MKPIALTLLATVTASMLSAPALGVNYGFLEYDPIAYFQDDDWKISDKAALDAVENGADGVVVKWSNPKTGASGAIKPLKTYTNKDGLHCRQVATIDRTTKPKLTGKYTFDVCKHPDGEWKFHTK